MFSWKVSIWESVTPSQYIFGVEPLGAQQKENFCNGPSINIDNWLFK